jgi:acylphosphatase
VQGVGFRAFVVACARVLCLAGVIWKRPDGGVWVEAEGSRDKLDRLLAELRQGPPAARVSEVHVLWEEPTGTKGFDMGWS